MVVEGYSSTLKILTQMKLTFEGTEEQLDLLKDEFDMLLIEHGDEKLPIIILKNK